MIIVIEIAGFISHCDSTLGKYMSPTVLSQGMGK